MLVAARTSSERGRRRPSEIPLALLLLHRAASVVVDQRGPGARRCVVEQHLRDDRRRASRRRSRPRRSADSSRACGSAPCACCGASPGSSGMRSSSTMISVPSRSTTGRCCGEVQRHDRDAPRGGCTARRRARSSSRAGTRGSLSPGCDAGVVEPPQLRALVLRVPAVLRGAEREDALLGARLLLVAARAAEGGVEAVLVERLLQRLGLHHVGVDAPSRGRTG